MHRHLRAVFPAGWSVSHPLLSESSVRSLVIPSIALLPDHLPMGGVVVHDSPATGGDSGVTNSEAREPFNVVPMTVS